MPKTRFSAIPALLFSVGLGLVFYYGSLWAQLPVYSPAEIAQSVEINLALDLQRRGATMAADSLEAQRLREALHTELLAEIQRERREAQRLVGAGLVALLMGLTQMFLLRRMTAR